MPTVEEYTDPYLRSFTPPPPVRPGVCEICHGWTGTLPDGSRYGRCSSCSSTARSVSRPVRLVVPVSLVVTPSQLYTVLSDYKNSRDAAARERLGLRVAALAARFLRDHGPCIEREAGRRWNTIAIVPSTRGRAGMHPLEQALLLARAHGPLYRRLLEATDVQVDHLSADERGYYVTEPVSGRAVLLVDDTFTTGARVQSAASALARAGADVVAAVALGRIIHPEFAEEARALWEQQRSIPFTFERCCLEA